jgi:hypothetical protein
VVWATVMGGLFESARSKPLNVAAKVPACKRASELADGGFEPPAVNVGGAEQRLKRGHAQ